MKSVYSAFSLIEILCVLAVISVMATLIGPVVKSFGRDNMENVQGQIQGILEQDREYARANRTYVRVGLVGIQASTGAHQVVVQSLESTTGDLRNDTVAGLADERLWKSHANPMIIDGVTLDDSLRDKIPLSSGSTVDVLGTNFTQFSRKCAGQLVTYAKIIQFDPQGQISQAPNVLARNTMIGFSNPQQSANPIVLLMSGLSGNIQVLRKENLDP